jgi:signal peptidase I
MTIPPKDLRASWGLALWTFLAPIFLVVFVRWALVEPFVVPSGSMIPTLFIHDHIFANKLAYGLHWPFSNRWLLHWASPQHGDVAVFRYPKTPDVFYVKRIVGLPGDEISVNHGLVYINGKKIEQEPIPLPAGADSSFQYNREGTHVVRYLDKQNSFFHPVKVPEGQFFAMGDNRDQSSDSRYWGFVPEENFVGSVGWIWMSCENTLPSASFLCDPQGIRWNRILIRVQ